MNKKTDAATIHEWRGVLHFLRWATPTTLALLCGMITYSINTQNTILENQNQIDIKLAVIISQSLHRDSYALDNRRLITGLDKRVTRLERMKTNNQ